MRLHLPHLTWDAIALLDIPESMACRRLITPD
jgi:hypothetical protein